MLWMDGCTVIDQSVLPAKRSLLHKLISSCPGCSRFKATRSVPDDHQGVLQLQKDNQTTTSYPPGISIEDYQMPFATQMIENLPSE